MCIIVSKEKNKNIPSKEILERCFKSNPDGAGFMYVYNKQVIIEKGFFTFKEFYKRLMEVDKSLNLFKKSLVMHFRIGTSGGYTAGACHPFPVSNTTDELKNTQTTCKLGMVHNGIISNFVYGTLSDTQNFVKDLVYPLFKINCNFLNNKNAIDLLYKQSGTGKLCFLDKNDDITYIGDFITDKGIKYSNNSYEERLYVPSFSKFKYGYDYDNDYGYDYDYDWEYEYDNDIGIYKRTHKNKEKDKNYWKAKDELKKLKKGMVCYEEDFTESILINEDDFYYIDERYNLYELVEEKVDWIRCKKILENCFVYENKDSVEDLLYEKI